MAEKILPYDRGIVAQETGYWCGPASTQIVLDSRGIKVAERDLAREIGTHTGGTDHIGLITPVLERRAPGGGYQVVELRQDPPTREQVDALWDHLVRSVAAGWGLVANIIAPPSNYPRAVPPSNQALRYGGGTVYHYVALMGFADDGGQRRVWWADPGFAPHGCWVSLEQTAGLIAGKGYAWPAGAAAAAPPPPAPTLAVGMTAAVLAEAMGCGLPRATEMLPGMVGAMRAAQITTPLRAAHWCAQIGHESVGLQYMEEIASGDAYEGRADLGNVKPGDGRRFKGSGPIQLTGRANFRAFTRWARENGHTDLDFEARPELVRDDPRWGFLAASWYWTQARPQLNALADADDLDGVTRAINGGLNGIADRRTRLARCKQLGVRLLPPPTDMEDPDMPDSKADLILDQLGPGREGWPSLGTTDEGLPLTLRDAVGQIRARQDRIERKVDALLRAAGVTP